MACQTAPTQYIKAASGASFAYRRFGKAAGLPCIFCNCFRANMDWWDPLLINTIAESREVILFDGQGVGQTRGEVQPSYEEWSKDVIAFAAALGIAKADFFGYSMGARTVQFVAYQRPDLVRKMVLAGASPLSPSSKFTEVRDSKYMMSMATSTTMEEGKAAFAYALFPEDDAGVAAFHAYWSRLQERSVEPPCLEQVPLDRGGWAQIEAITNADKIFVDHGDDPLRQLHMPALVANGDDDKTLGTPRSINLFERLENAQLIVYPRSGHGFLFQYADKFGEDVNSFLDRDF